MESGLLFHSLSESRCGVMSPWLDCTACIILQMIRYATGESAIYSQHRRREGKFALLGVASENTAERNVSFSKITLLQVALRLRKIKPMKIHDLSLSSPKEFLR